MNNKRRKPNQVKKAHSVKCSCGKMMKSRTRMNYPFGVKSAARCVSYYKCTACGTNTN